MTVLTLGGSWLLFGRLGINAVGVAWLGTDVLLALVRLPTVLAALRRRPGVVARPASAPQSAAAPASRAQAQSRRLPNRRNYSGRHRATGPGENSAAGRP